MFSLIFQKFERKGDGESSLNLHELITWFFCWNCLGQFNFKGLAPFLKLHIDLKIDHKKLCYTKLKYLHKTSSFSFFYFLVQILVALFPWKEIGHRRCSLGTWLAFSPFVIWLQISPRLGKLQIWEPGGPNHIAISCGIIHIKGHILHVISHILCDMVHVQFAMM